ncbi:hypothetical protein ACFXPX_26970 [Kitasatospora sp. NPDC059146]|uniref:hypothetical protein n=1 Tax=unclassified Kitasatospora TaxID=2633591 RepID=UPI0036B7ECB4
MAIKIIATLVWTAGLIGVVKLLSGNDLAQCAAIFVLSGLYALLIDKLPSPRDRDEGN